jgi:hypothetical protein
MNSKKRKWLFFKPKLKRKIVWPDYEFNQKLFQSEDGIRDSETGELILSNLQNGVRIF